MHDSSDLRFHALGGWTPIESPLFFYTKFSKRHASKRKPLSIPELKNLDEAESAPKLTSPSAVPGKSGRDSPSATHQEQNFSLTKLPDEILQIVGLHTVNILLNLHKQLEKWLSPDFTDQEWRNGVQDGIVALLKLFAVSQTFRRIFLQIFYQTIPFQGVYDPLQTHNWHMYCYPIHPQVPGTHFWIYTIPVDIMRSVRVLVIDCKDLRIIGLDKWDEITSEGTVAVKERLAGVQHLTVMCRDSWTTGWNPSTSVPKRFRRAWGPFQLHLPSETAIRKAWAARLHNLPALKTVQLTRKISQSFLDDSCQPYNLTFKTWDKKVYTHMDCYHNEFDTDWTGRRWVTYAKACEMLVEHDQTVSTMIADLLRDKNRSALSRIVDGTAKVPPTSGARHMHLKIKPARRF